MAILSVLLAATAAQNMATVDLALDRRCFPEREVDWWTWFGLPHIFSTFQPVRLQVSSWQSSRAVSALADIVLRELLDHTVELLEFEDADTYAHLAAGEVDVNLELWPGLPHKQREKEQALRLVCAYGKPCISFKGGLGYIARSGTPTRDRSEDKRRPTLRLFALSERSSACLRCSHTGWFIPLATIPSDLAILHAGFVDESSGGASSRSDLVSRGHWQSIE